MSYVVDVESKADVYLNVTTVVFFKNAYDHCFLLNDAKSAKVKIFRKWVLTS